MPMIRYCLFLCLLLPALGRAESVCTLVNDMDRGRMLVEEGDCGRALSPASTFKIPLSLMGYDSGYLTDEALPALPYRAAYTAVLPAHQQETTPAAWMKYSVVWYSQLLAEWLGMQRLQRYVDVFAYGNRDLSGDAGKNNGLTHAWLSSSLKVAPHQQMDFLVRLLRRQLPVAERAYRYTERLLKQDETVNGYSVYGKTGTGTPVDEAGAKREDRQFGWYVGWAQGPGGRFVFVYAIDGAREAGVFAGPKAKAELLSRLAAVLPGAGR